MARCAIASKAITYFNSRLGPFPFADLADEIVVVRTMDGQQIVGELVPSPEGSDWLSLERFVAPTRVYVRVAAVSTIEAAVGEVGE